MKLLIKILTCLIPGKERRKRFRRMLRSELYTFALKRKARCVGRGSLSFGRFRVNRNTSIGEATCFEGDFVVLGEGDVHVGSHCSFGPNVVIQTQSHEYESDTLPYGHGWRRKPVEIGDAVWVGMNVQILPGTRIGDGAIIQMGSVVHGTIPPCSIAGGNPAKVFSSRDKAHFEELVRKNAYLHE